MLVAPASSLTIRKGLARCAIMLCLWFIGHSLYVLYDGLRQGQAPADAAVILGNTVNPDGSLSPRLESRLAKGLALYQQHQVKHIVVSGGFGQEGHYEGSKMRDYLIQHGVPTSDISVDNQGNTTALTAHNLQQHPRRAEFNSVIVVSQYFHLTRIKMLFHHYGFNHLQGASPRYFEWRDLYALPREFVAFYAYLIKNN